MTPLDTAIALTEIVAYAELTRCEVLRRNEPAALKQLLVLRERVNALVAGTINIGETELFLAAGDTK